MPLRIGWADCSWPELREAAGQDAIVILPLGSTEQHGRHLPVGTDHLLVQAIASRACLTVHTQVAAIHLPAFWIGFSPYHMSFSGTLTFRASTYVQVLSEICEGIAQHGFRRVLLLNGHGGNLGLASAAIADVRHRNPQVAVVAASYWDLAADEINQWRRSGSGGISHGGELETALALAIREELVDLDKATPNITDHSSAFISDDLLGGGRVFFPTDTADLSSTGTIGDPTLASKARGEEILNLVVGAVARFLVEFGEWDLDRPGAI